MKVKVGKDLEGLKSGGLDRDGRWTRMNGGNVRLVGKEGEVKG